VKGATPQDWQLLADQGLVADLLPVVSETSLPISPRSRIAQAGKTPSLVNAGGHIAGLAKWTERVTTLHDVKRWSADPRLGICVQTRRVRALDVDIDDPAISGQVRDVVEALAGAMPCRSRSNSGKLLLAFRMEGDFSKRKIKTATGQIEFLATGQQFIAMGTHTSGVRYEWDGLEGGIPTLAPAEFVELWSALADAFGLEAADVERTATAHDDPVLGLTEEDIRACFKALDPNLGHDEWVQVGMATHHETRGAGFHYWDEFSAAGGGYPGTESLEYRWSTFGRKSFGPVVTGRTLVKLARDAATAAGVTLGLSIDAGASADDFEVVAAAEHGVEDTGNWPPFARDKGGRIEPTISNVVAGLLCRDFSQVRVGRDAFKDTTMVAYNGVGTWRPLKDTDYTQIRIQLEGRGFKNPGRELVRDAVLKVAEDHEFDSAIQWGRGQVWDGVKRVDTCMVRYFNAEDTPYARAVGRYLWTALAGRLLTPGEEVHMVPVLVGAQGSGKTQGVKALSPTPDAFVEVNLEHRDDNLARGLRGKLVGELGELRGLQSRDAEAIKAWISRSHEEWTPKYMEFTTKFPRRVVFIGTTNTDEFLADDTGERRWLPLRVGTTDLASLRDDRDQLWAEAIHLYRAGGVQWAEAQTLAVDEHAAFKVEDPWLEPIRSWLLASEDFEPGDQPRCVNPFKLTTVLHSALGLATGSHDQKALKRAARVLRALGFEKQRATRNSGGKSVWIPAKNCELVEFAKCSAFS